MSYEKPKKPIPRRCKIFHCDRRKGSFCCTDCGYNRPGGCRNPCLNGPERCGQVLLENRKTTGDSEKI